MARSLCFAILGATLLLWTLATQASNPNFKLCYRQALNVPGPNFGQPPVVDGVIINDFGWTDGWRYVFGNGTPTADAVVQAIRTGTDLYMSFEVNNDASFDDQDVIVLTLDPDGTAANQRRLHIFPVFTGTGAGGGGAPRSVEYWTNSGTWGAAAASPPPAGTDIKVTSSGVSPNVSYFVEVKLPRAAYGIPGAGNFGAYFNIMRVNGGAGTVNEKFWPTDAPPIGLFLNTNTPPANTWGTASVSGVCNGVSITPSDITTNNVPPSKIALNGPNIFSANVHNNSIDAAGNPIAANQVTATFRIANFGLPSPSSWANVPAPGNPTGQQNVPASGNLVFSTGAWNLTAAQQATYNTPTTTHQCILVELDSTAPNTTFVNKSAWTNMDFGTASTSEQVAEISAKGYDKPADGKPIQVFDLQVATRVDELNPQGPSTAPGMVVPTQKRVAQYTWVLNGYRRTGKYVQIQDKKYEIVDGVGSYGYFIRHELGEGLKAESVKWNFNLSANGLKKMGLVQGNNETMYQLDVPVDGATALSTVITTGGEGGPGASPSPTTPPKPGMCGQAKGYTGGIVLLAGVFATGFMIYRPRRRRGRTR